MAKGKYTAKRARPLRGKTLTLILVLVLALSCVVGGTVAWLIAQSDTVVNTFTYGDINITLTETDTQDGDGSAQTNTYKMVPGGTITKDPVVTVKAGSEALWLFVRVSESEDFGDFMTYDIQGLGSEWLALAGEEGVYYRSVTAEAVADGDAAFPVIANNTVTVKDTVTKEMLNALDADGAENYPTLTLTAYAVQAAGSDTADEAWAKLPGET